MSKKKGTRCKRREFVVDDFYIDESMKEKIDEVLKPFVVKPRESFLDSESQLIYISSAWRNRNEDWNSKRSH